MSTVMVCLIVQASSCLGSGEGADFCGRVTIQIVFFITDAVVMILNILVLFQKVDLLCGVGVKRLCCGTQFTVFLTQDGRVFTCGMDRLIGQPDSRARGHTKPQQVSFMYSRMRC
jgi:hypothetical protein